MLVPTQLKFNMELNDDDELIHKANATDNGRVVVNSGAPSRAKSAWDRAPYS